MLSTSAKSSPDRAAGARTLLRDVSFVRSKTIMGNEAAEEGRKKSYMFPPLTKEHTIPPDRKKFTSSQLRDNAHLYQGPIDELASSHWHYGTKRLSPELDNRIVNHLRKKLTKRVERRFHQFLTDESNAFSEKEKQDGIRLLVQNDSQKTDRTNVDIFSKYSEFGERVSRETISQKNNSAKRRRSKSNSSVNQRSRSISPIKTYSYSSHEDIRVNELERTSKTELQQLASSLEKLPPISTILVNSEEDHSEKIEENNNSSDIEEIEASISNSEGELLNLLGKDNDEIEDIDFMEIPISPVPTPSLHRPATRINMRNDTYDTIEKIISGQVNVAVVPQQKIYNIFISADFTDTEVERTFLLEKLYTRVKSQFYYKGVEVQLFDPHWGLKDTTCDGHWIPEMSLSVLNKCQENTTTGINFISFLGQKYGKPLVPFKIPADEFEKIINAAQSEKDLMVILAEQRTANESAARNHESCTPELGDKDDSKTNISGDLNSLVEISLPVNKEEHDKMSDSNTHEKPTSISDSNPLNGQNDPLVKRTSILNIAYNGPSLSESSVIADDSRRVLHHGARKGKEPDLTDCDVDLLKNWYKLDTNAVPPVYVLQSISSYFPDIIRNDANKRSQAKNLWMTTSTRILKILKHFDDLLGSNIMYKTSLQALELDHILEDETHMPHCFWLNRNITDLHEQALDINTGRYLDMELDHNALDSQATARLHSLTESIVEKLPPKNTHEYMIQWTKDGVDLKTRSHLLYVERMVADLQESITRSVETVLKNQAGLRKHDNYNLYDEIASHVNFCQDRSKHFHGQKQVLHMAKAYLRSDCSVPFIMYGQSGIGKTSLMAKIVKETPKWLNENTAVLVRFIGQTTDSRNIRTLLHDMCLQLCHIFDNDPLEIPTDYKGLVNDFNYRLKQASSEKNIVIALDALDALSNNYEARNMLWLPKSLPRNVHVFLSTLHEEKYGSLKALRSIYGSHTDYFVEIPNLHFSDGTLILEHWFHSRERKLTDKQQLLLTESLKHCLVPLYMRVCFSEMISWPSYHPESSTKLSESLRKMVLMMFGRLEKMHGEALVRRCLGYITASRNGLTQNELEDILSIDEAVMDEVALHYQVNRRHLPCIVLARLLFDIGEYIKPTKTHSCLTIQWKHVSFFEAAEERYLKQKDKAPSYHKSMAEYFLSKWSNGNPKPQTNTDTGSDRYIMPQNLFLEGKLENPRLYNRRAILELPHHLLRSQQTNLLKSECLCNFGWLVAALCSTSVHDLLEEFNHSLEVEPNDNDLKLLVDTIHLSRKAILRDPHQLGSQIIGRLHRIIIEDKPAAPQDPLVYPFIHPLIDQIQKSSAVTLIPSTTCLTPPKGLLFDILSGHTEPITAVAVTTLGTSAVTTAKDDTLKVWDLNSGRVTKSIKGVGKDTIDICLALGNNVAITSELKQIRAWSLRSSECLMTVAGLEDNAIISTAGQGDILVALLDGSNLMRTWNLVKMKPMHEVRLDTKGVHKERSLLLAGNMHGNNVLYAFRSSNNAVVQNARKGKKIFDIMTKDPSASIQALAITGEYFVIACRYQYMKLQEIVKLEIFDAHNGSYIRNIRGCLLDNVKGLYINQLGSHALCISNSEGSNSSNIAIWNLETEDHKHMANHTGQSVMGACSDFRYCLTAGKNDTALRIWNLSTSINKPAPKMKKIEGIEDLSVISHNPRYVVAKSTNNSTVSVWNVARYKEKAVSIERGLSDGQDVMLIRDTKVIILTDKSFSTISENAQQIFSTVLIFDLVTRKYEKKLTGVFIVPLPVHEYRLLSGNRLLGLADNRNHFIVWSLDSGQVMYYIRPDFRSRIQLDHSFSKNIDPQKIRKRGTTAKMTPWERRAETVSARKGRRNCEEQKEIQRLMNLHKEKTNAIDQYILSEDEKVIVASFYAHHLCVFDVETQAHLQTLENENSMLFLYTAALTFDGRHLAMANYDDDKKISYVTLWDCKSGQVHKRIKNEKGVYAIAITRNAERVAFGKDNNEIRVWDPFSSSSLRKIKGYPGLSFGVKSKIFLVGGGDKAVVFSNEISVWDLNKGVVQAVFSPDKTITSCNIAMDGQLVAFGLRDSQEVITLQTMPHTGYQGQKGVDMFGEVSSSEDETETDED